MHARGGKPDQLIADHDVAARQDLAALDRTDGEAGEVIVARLVHARHFGGFAADQRAAGLPAAIGDAGNDRLRGLYVELSAGKIIEEEQRLGALHHEIVDAHGDEIDADGRVLAGIDGDLQLGADAVGGRYEDRIAETGAL